MSANRASRQMLLAPQVGPLAGMCALFTRTARKGATVMCPTP